MPRGPVKGRTDESVGRCAGLADIARARRIVEGEARLGRGMERCKGRLQAARLVEARGRRGWRGRSGSSRRCWRTEGATRWAREAWAAARAAAVGEVATEARAEARRAAKEARAGSRTGPPSCTSTPTVPGPRSCRGSHALSSRQGSRRTASRVDGKDRHAEVSAWVRGGGGLQLAGRLVCGGVVGKRPRRT